MYRVLLLAFVSTILLFITSCNSEVTSKIDAENNADNDTINDFKTTVHRIPHASLSQIKYDSNALVNTSFLLLNDKDYLISDSFNSVKLINPDIPAIELAVLPMNGTVKRDNDFVKRSLYYLKPSLKDGVDEDTIIYGIHILIGERHREIQRIKLVCKRK